MNMRKIIAVLAAALLLCSIIPMGAISVSAADAVFSSDFEDGTIGDWTVNGSVALAATAAADLPVANSNGGNYAMRFESSSYSYMNHTITVEANTTYQVTFSILSGTSGYPINARIRTTSSTDLALNAYTPSTTAWETYSFSFNSGSNTSLHFRFQAAYKTGTYYVDNLSIVPLEGDVSDDGHILNGDFETGDALNWVASANTAVVEDPTDSDQGYVMQTSEDTTSVTMFSQTAKNLTANTDYVLSFKVYGYTTTGATNSAFWVRFAKTITEWTVESTLESASYNAYTPRINVNSNLNAWYDVKITFNTGDLTETIINFMNYRGSNGYYYFDDIQIALPPKAPDVPDNAVYFEDFEGSHTWASNNTDCPSSLVAATDLPVANDTCQYYAMSQTIPSDLYPYMSDNTAFTVTPNTDYVLSFEVLNTSTNWPIQAIIAPNYWLGNSIFSTTSQTIKPSAQSWETYTVVFNSGDNTSLYVGLKSQWANTTFYFDNVWIAPLNYEVANDGYLVDGDFETGNGLEWLHTDNTGIIEDPTDSSQGYVMSTNENTSSTHMFFQIAKNLIAGETYTLSFKVYGYSSLTTSAFFLKFPSTCSDFTYGGDLVGYVYSGTTSRFNVTTNTGKWLTATVTFTTTAETATLDFQNYRSNAGQYYFDDIVLTHNHTYEYDCSEVCSVCGVDNPDAVAHTSDAEYACTDGVCTVCGADVAGTGHEYFYPCDIVCQICYEETNESAAHSLVYVEAVEPTCTALGNVEYWYCEYCGAAWLDEACTQMTNQMSVKLPMAEHEYFYPCDPVCVNCYEITNESAAHSTVHVEAVEATCGVNGNIEYWYCEYCGAAWADEALTQVTNRFNVIVPATGEHTSDAEYECTDGVCTVCGADVAGTGHSYYYACDAYCEICYELTNESAAHSITHVEAVAATCTVNGNIEYWTCEYCGGCWDNENGTGMPLNRMMVIEWASHTYDDDYDVDCNVCGDIRVVEYELVTCGGNSISEDVSGLAFKFDIAVDGLGNNGTVAIYDAATVTPTSESGALKLIGMGAVVSNNWGITYLDYVDGAHVIDVPAVYLCDLEADSASYAVRIINIPESAYDTYVTARPYYIYEDAEGNEVVVYGYEEMATFNGVLEG